MLYLHIPHHADDYDFAYVPAPQNTVCLMCREPYNDGFLPPAEACHAIRLTHCSHIIGYECFSTWLKKHDGTCPYWNHKLPPPSRESLSITTLLTLVCSSSWFLATEKRLMREKLGCKPKPVYRELRKRLAKL